MWYWLKIIAYVYTNVQMISHEVQIQFIKWKVSVSSLQAQFICIDMFMCELKPLAHLFKR